MGTLGGCGEPSGFGGEDRGFPGDKLEVRSPGSGRFPTHGTHPLNSAPLHRCGHLRRAPRVTWPRASAPWRGRRVRAARGAGRPALCFCGSARGGRGDQACTSGPCPGCALRTVLTEHVADTKLGERGEGPGRGRPFAETALGGRWPLANGGPQPAPPPHPREEREPDSDRAQLRCAPSRRAQSSSWPLERFLRPFPGREGGRAAADGAARFPRPAGTFSHLLPRPRPVPAPRPLRCALALWSGQYCPAPAAGFSSPGFTERE